MVREAINKRIAEDLQTKGVLGDVKWFVALPWGHVDLCPRPGGSENIQKAYDPPGYERFGPCDPAREDLKSFYEGSSTSISQLFFWITYQMRYVGCEVLEHGTQDDIYNCCRQYIRSEGMKHVEQARKDDGYGRLEHLIKCLDYE
jgi:hypothetical protein